MTFFRLSVFLFILLASTWSSAFDLTSKDQDLLFGQFEVEFLNDENGDLTLKEVLSTSTFQSVKELEDALFEPNQVKWFRLYVTNKSALTWLLEVPDAHISNIDFYQVSDKGEVIRKSSAGSRQAAQSREIPHKNHVFELRLDQSQSSIYYLRVKSEYPSLAWFHLRTVNYFTGYALYEYYMLGAFYGMMLIMTIYSLLMFLSTRDRMYAFYIGYLMSCALYAVGEDMTGAHLFWNYNSGLGHIFFKYGSALWLIGFVLFSYSFLKSRLRSPYWKYSAIGTVLVAAISASFALDIHNWLLVIVVGTVAYRSYRLYSSGVRYARYFFFGYVIVFVGILTFVLRIHALIETTWYSYYLTYFTFILEALVFALAMFDRIKQIKQDKEDAQAEVISQLEVNQELQTKVNRELESRVDERTKELASKTELLEDANLRLQEMSEELQTMNAQMDKENWQLQREVKESKRIKIERKVFSFEEFKEVYPDNTACMKYLSERKWTEDFSCRKCSHNNFMKGEKPHSRKCTKCKYDESPMIATLFQGVRFDLNKAFYIAYHTLEAKSKLTMDQLSEKLELRRNTCWSFKKKVEERMEVTKAENWKDLILEQK